MLFRFDNEKWGSLSSFLSYMKSALKLMVFLARHIVTTVTCYIKNDRNFFTNDWAFV